MKFYRDEPRTLRVTALLRPDGAELLGRLAPTGEVDGEALLARGVISERRYGQQPEPFPIGFVPDP